MAGTKPRKLILIIIAGISLIFVSALLLLPAIVKQEIRTQLADISPALQVRFSKIHVGIFASSVSLDSFDISIQPYESLHQNRHTAYFSRVVLQGISVLKFLFSHELQVKELLLTDGRIQLDSFLLIKTDSAQSELFRQANWPFRKFLFRQVEVRNASVAIRPSVTNQMLCKGDIMVAGISGEKDKSPTFASIDMRLHDINYSMAGCSVHAKQLLLASNKNLFELDSLRYVFQNQPRAEGMISSLRVTGFDGQNLFDSGILYVKEIKMGKSKMVIPSGESLAIPSLFFRLRKVRAASFEFENGFISYAGNATRCWLTATASAKAIGVNIGGNNTFTIGSIKADLSGIHYTGNSYHEIEVKSMRIDSKQELIRVNDIEILPTYRKYEFERKLGHQADWIRASISKIEIIKPDIANILNKKLVAQKMKWGESNVYIFRDRRFPRPQKDIPLPIDYMKSLGFDIRVRECALENSTISYEEYPKDGYGLTGVLKIANAKATLSPLISRPLPEDPAFVTMQVQASIMGSGTASGIIKMPLDQDSPYKLRGTIENLDLTKLNSSSENLGKIRIKSGFLDYLSFDFTMTKQRSTGKIVGVYHHLVIQPLKKNVEQKNVADAASFVLRRVVIPFNKGKSLPERKRSGLVNYPRDPTRMVSHYFLQSLLVGIKKSFALGFLLPK